MGAGRSGSTVLDTVLGGHPEIESVGELVNASKAFSNPFEYCACGERAGDCPFWAKVRDEWKKLSGYKDISELAELQHHYERVRRLPYLYLSRLFGTAGYKRYLHAQQSLFQAIAIVSGKGIVVESSKSPVRAFALANMLDVDFYVIHLVRDGRGVAWSLKKSYKKDPKAGVQQDLHSLPIWKTALSWAFVNMLSEMLFRNFQHSMQVFYEEFVENTDKVLNLIGDFMGVSFHGINNMINNEGKIPVGHTVAGNRLRMTGVIKLNPDYEWKKSLSELDKNSFGYIVGWLLRRYGYCRKL